MEIVSIIDVEDAAAIQSKIKECIEKDPGAFEEETLILKMPPTPENQKDSGVDLNT
jgi:tetrahydromethanopterin S-methyltransferase subunit A